MNENAIDLNALSEKLVSEWTLAECKAYCKAASDAGNCETEKCLLCDFCQDYLKHSPIFWWTEND